MVHRIRSHLYEIAVTRVLGNGRFNFQGHNVFLRIGFLLPSVCFKIRLFATPAVSIAFDFVRASFVGR